jgi:2,5-diketo-D-gluconate reductase A
MSIQFTNGGSVPLIGLGTWPMEDAEGERVVAEALQLGYRLVDTAFAYGNEIGVGRGVAASGIDREDVFITTKFNRESHSVAGVALAFEDAARKLGVEYIDLMLIHWPNPDQDRYVEAWEGLIALREQGKVRHIGTSNFLPKYLDRIISATGVVPELNQLQVNPRHLQRGPRAYNAELGIVTQSWSPLGQGTGLVELPIFSDLADKYGCTPGQVILAWHVNVGLCAIPKSSNTQRLMQNLRAQDIDLDSSDIATIEALDGTEPDVKDPDAFMH